VNGSIQVLRLEIGSDRRAFEERAGELATLVLTPKTTDPNLLARAAVALHHAYGAIESAMARIAKVFSTEPAGGNWHRSLLETMSMDVPGIRPAVLTASSLPALRDLLAFRHFFRHAYSVPLDPARLCALRDRVGEVRSQLLSDFDRLDAWLASVAARS
jgi:hypothetical protein